MYLRLLETTMSQKNILRVQYSIFACSYKNSEKVKDDEKNCMQTFKSQVLVNITVIRNATYGYRHSFNL